MIMQQPHSPASQLKLVDPDLDLDVLRFERRAARRRSISGQVTAVHHTTDPGQSPNRICSLQLVNISDTGLGVMAPQWMEPGSFVEVYFAAHGAEGGFDLRGRVVRCIKRENGHEVGIRLGARNAA